MADLTGKIEALERQLDKLSNVFDNIRKSLTTEHPKQRHSVRTKTTGGRPAWVEEVFQHFNKISAELKSVKETLDTRSFTDSGNSPSDASVTDIGAEAELQHEASSQGQSEREQVSTAGLESGEPVPVATNALERVEPASPTPEQDIQAQELAPQVQQVPISCKASLMPSKSTEPPHHITQLNGALPDPLSDDGNPPTFRCNYKDISGNLNETKLLLFSSDLMVRRKGYFKLSVGGLPPLNVEETSFNQPGKGHWTNFSSQPVSRGCVKITKGQNQEVKFPGFPLPECQREPWSRRTLKEVWEGTLKESPRDMLYVIGDPLFSDIELSPGEGLKRIEGYRNLRGIGTTYIYLSFGVSFSIIHGEDAKFRSMNLLRSGEDKLWLIVEPAYEKELEHHMREEFPEMANCSQALRHLSRIITPRKLDEWKIPYSLDYCKPGEAIVTEPGALHQVLNVGANYAIAINTLYDSSPTVPKGYKFCQKSCDPHGITAVHLRLREEGGPLTEVQANKKAGRPRDQVTAIQPKIIPSKRKATSTEPQSGMPPVTPQMGSLVEAVCGKVAFYHLCSLVYSWRDRSKPFFEKNDGGAPAVHLVQVIGALEKKSYLTEFLGRFAKVKLVEVIDERKDGRIRADPVAITNLINDLRWENTRTNRRKLHYYLEEGRRWKRICGSFNGLLCLIPPNRDDGESLKVSGRVYQELSDKNIELFHSLLKADEFVQPMCRVGKTFQASIWADEEVPEFKWEGEDPKEISRLSIKELIPFIEEFSVKTENEYKPEKYDWPRPDRWLWDWPQHPMWVPPSDHQCDLCDKEKCNCISTCLPKNKPRITNELGKGQGVRVIGLTYIKGQILEEFRGEVVPLETYHDGWPMEFIRPDLGDEPVAQIYPREMGNWVRKVNHSCHPSAEFRVMKISGWWRQMLVAIQDISHNSEITAFCGRNFLKGQGKECFCEVCSGYSTPQQG
ncbi:JmjC domain, hydroxylase-domain-containing protein [Tricladium varicosporioides]|nr:JmjC domain, hydroxylase-domain-containing protein [Hymenoscyphus varicosporioides]